MSKTFERSILIGRFQPFHNGHLQIVRSALEDAEELLILVGSANLARTTRNPFTFTERSQTIRQVLMDEGLLDRVCHIAPLNDNPYDNAAWITSVQGFGGGEYGTWRDKSVSNIAITGHNRDHSSFYLKKFPQWTFQPPKTDLLHLNATALRHSFLLHGVMASVCPEYEWLPKASMDFLCSFQKTDAFKALQEEYIFEVNYRERWGKGPFMTVDNVVIQSGHVLVVERKKTPGKGLLAMPGGHLEVGEPLDEAAVRELWEETQIFRAPVVSEDSPPDVLFDIMKQRLWPHYRARQCFDNPNRSTRAHVITMAHLFKLPDAPYFPDVVGSDDAARAFWLPLSEMKPTDFFEDHFFIIQKMLGRLG